METPYSLVILYLIVFRLAIITAGTVCIVLGYKLFVKGVFSDASGGTGVEAGLGSLKLTMKNAAPGSVFAFFGVVVISIMLLQAPPGLEQENGKVKLRGEDDAGPAAATEPGTGLETAVRELIESVETYHNGVQNLGRHLARFSNRQAWKYYEASRFDEGLPLADIGVKLAPKDADHLDTLARLLFAKERYEEALHVMQRAANLDPKHEATLQKFRRDMPK